jgi:hypothetical protein
MSGRTIREALRIALEGLPSKDIDINIGARALRDHLRAFIIDYGKTRGVIFSNHDVDDELRAVVTEVIWGPDARPSQVELTPPPIEMPEPEACGMCYGCVTGRGCVRNW